MLMMRVAIATLSKTPRAISFGGCRQKIWLQQGQGFKYVCNKRPRELAEDKRILLFACVSLGKTH